MRKSLKLKIDATDQQQKLSCCSCKNQISITAEQCPLCGCTDPFYFKAIIDEYKERFPSIRWLNFLVFAGAIVLFLRGLDTDEGLIMNFLFFLFLFAILWGIFCWIPFKIYDNRVKRYEPRNKINYLSNDVNEMYLWEEYVARIPSLFVNL